MVRNRLDKVARPTVRCWRRVGPREDRLCGSALPLEDLENCADLIFDLDVVINLALETLEDLWIYRSQGARHDDRRRR